jgi:hypothetical protein
MSIIQKERLDSLRRWQTLTASHYQDLSGALESIEIHRIDILQRSLLTGALELNRITSLLDNNDLGILPIKELESKLDSFQKMVVQFFEEEDILTSSLGLTYDPQHERDHSDLIRFSTVALQEFKNGKIKIALSIHDKVISNLIKHFNESNKNHYNIQKLTSHFMNAKSWIDLAPIFDFPHYNIQDFKIQKIIEETLMGFQKIEDDQITNLHDFWNKLGPDLIKFNNFSQANLSNWKLTSEMIVQTLQDLIRRTDKTLLELSANKFSENKMLIFKAYFAIFRHWYIDHYTNEVAFNEKIENSIHYMDVSIAYPIKENPKIDSIYKDILSLVLEFKSGIRSLHTAECFDFINSMGKKIEELETYDNIFIKQQKDHLRQHFKSLNRHVLTCQTIITKTNINAIFHLLIRKWHFHAYLKENLL